MTGKKLLSIPLYILSVFTWSKSFRTNPVIGSYTLNLLGLHVFRVVVSHLFFNFRLMLLSPLASASDRVSFRQNGFVIKENFLPQEQFQALQNEILNYRGKIRDIREGSTLTQRVFLTSEALTRLPLCRQVRNDPDLLRLIRYASSKNRIPFFYIENLRHEALTDNGEDPQKDLHTDTFHPCVKAWLFIDDVTDENGPFVYAPGSQRLSWKRIKWEYAESLAASRMKNSPNPHRYWDGSFRVSDKALQALGMKPKALKVPANTLVIANTHGFHRRGAGRNNTSRMAIWMQARDNPFNPLFFPFPQLTAQVFEAIWCSYLNRRDAKMQQEGTLTTIEAKFDVCPRSTSDSAQTSV